MPLYIYSLRNPAVIYEARRLQGDVRGVRYSICKGSPSCEYREPTLSFTRRIQPRANIVRSLESQ